jgi:serine phosphatase RsbU (regulator of sigma subunit)
MDTMAARRWVVRFSIRLKLGLLAGIPVFGAAILALLIVTSARSDAAKASALGSIERLADLSLRMTDLVHALQTERALRALTLADPRAGAAQVESAAATTDRDLASLSKFLSQHDEKRLPGRLSLALGDARHHLETLPAFRARFAESGVTLEELDDFYSKGTRSLIRATSGLTDLSDDGELLRLLSALCLALELEERMSEEHALLADVFTERRFPPGSYRKLVTVISEQEIYASVYRTLSTLPAVRLMDGVISGPAVERAKALRNVALQAAEEDDFNVDPAEWFALGNETRSAIGRAERRLNEESRRAAVDKLARTRHAVNVSVGLASAVVVVSLLLAWAIAYGLTRRVTLLRDLSQAVAEGDLDARVESSASDELGDLASSFNDMVGQLRRAQSALSEQARMTRELEIAAAIQHAMLPPTPSHAEFEFAGRMRPADEVGGDFYDVLTGSDREALWITMGDVSGHGVGAGLVMLMAQAAFASHFLDNPAAQPSGVLRAVNTLLCENIRTRLRDDKYVTTQLLTRTAPGRFECVGAHEWPIVFRAATGQCETIEAPGPWLGISPELPEIPTYAIELSPGDVLCLYSDGIAEARGEGQTLFDVERMSETIATSFAGRASLDTALEDLFSAAERFSGRHDDDWTVLLVRRV